VILRARGISARDVDLEAAAVLSRRGVGVAFGSSGSLVDPAVTQALAVRFGLDPRLAIAAWTSVPTELFGLAGSLGTIRAGADADVVVWSGDPLSLQAAVERVYVDGQLVYSAERDDRFEEEGGDP
jgi:imidazolonepropionase-like amidohydrolase